jgi:hypothetical protein
MDNVTEFHLPVIPYGPSVALNRMAAALGSPRYAMAASGADYNGHHIKVWWNEHNRYYIAEYTWAGRIVIERGSFAACLRAALTYYERGALGSSAEICPRSDDEAALALCRADERIAEGSFWVRDFNGCRPRYGAWYTWMHEVASKSARDSANPRGLVRIFDWGVMQTCQSLAEYVPRSAPNTTVRSTNEPRLLQALGLQA